MAGSVTTGVKGSQVGTTANSRNAKLPSTLCPNVDQWAPPPFGFWLPLNACAVHRGGAG
ncbi:hypothetical protein ZHAS_00020391 [Anopheles sinensis]|uniref:Uncharacterized protein n=1 Tax=Anopheles sinensis TaxID=74873 RepID=A0A084WPX9_ANOSI|nr:hypothetical protein ZHAS_00020391 [Anopheles sinensis]